MDLRYMRGFIQMQNLIERALIKVVTDMNKMPLDDFTKEAPIVYLQQFPYPKYKQEEYERKLWIFATPFSTFLHLSNTGIYVNYFILPIVITLMWSGNIGLAIRNLVKDKEKFIEEVSFINQYLYSFVLFREDKNNFWLIKTIDFNIFKDFEKK